MKSDSATIQDSEEALESFLTSLRKLEASHSVQTEILNFLAPAGFRPIVALQEEGRKKRRSASAENWNPETGEILVYFERIAEPEADSASPSPLPPALTDGRIGEIVRSLEEAETVPGHSFVALKWFRDVFLPAKGYPWTQHPDQRHEVLSKAIADGWILTSKVTNPQQPLYPTTTIRLNRQKKPSGDAKQASRFRPVPIQGEPLSTTILRDRGTR